MSSTVVRSSSHEPRSHRPSPRPGLHKTTRLQQLSLTPWLRLEQGRLPLSARRWSRHRDRSHRLSPDEPATGRTSSPLVFPPFCSYTLHRSSLPSKRNPLRASSPRPSQQSLPGSRTTSFTARITARHPVVIPLRPGPLPIPGPGCSKTTQTRTS